MGAEAVTALAGAVTTSGSYKSIDLTLNKVLLPAVEEKLKIILKTFELKMAQAKAGIWL